MKIRMKIKVKIGAKNKRNNGHLNKKTWLS